MGQIQNPLQMAAVLVLVQLVTVMPMKSEASSADDTSVSTNSDGSVLLASGLMLGRMEQRWDDIRWTHRHLVVSLKNNMTRCHHGRCELLSDGSLMFRTVQNEDLGNYSLEVFDEDGTRLMKREFVLREGGGESSSSSVVVSISCLLLLFLLLFIIIFILRRRIQRTNTPGRREENVYVTMHSQHGNKKKDDTEKQEKEEDSVYVSCHPIAVETPMTEDIYV